MRRTGYPARSVELLGDRLANKRQDNKRGKLQPWMAVPKVADYAVVKVLGVETEDPPRENVTIIRPSFFIPSKEGLPTLAHLF